MTEDSPSRTRGYGPFQEGAEPTAPIPAQPTGAEQPGYAASAPRGGSPQPAVEQPLATGSQDPTAPVPQQSADVPPSAQNGETPPGGHPGPVAEPAAAQPDLYATPAPDQDPTVAYPPQPTTPYPVTPTGMNPHYAATSSHVDYPPDPTSPTPASPTPTSAAPADGALYPGATSGSPYPGATSGSPYPGATSGSPYPGATSGSPYPGATSGPPYPTSGGLPAYGPFRGSTDPTSAAPDPYDFAAPAPFTSRRIEPSPPPDRSRLLIGIVAGLVAGLLVFGAGGWFAGRATATKADPKPAPTPSATSSLGVFEQSQVALNQPHFAATGLVTISQGWLPYLSSCARSGEPGGPALNAGEKTRVRCTLDGMSAIFVEYNSISDRDKARVKTLDQNVDARTLAPGVGAATQRPTPSGRTNGNYVEYAYKLTEGGVTRPVAALWWDDAQTPVAGYLLAYWKEGLGESWDPMRDLWARYA